ncbi:uncharacterized protein MONBRDRAFT_27677, partial [Monosiga brevicollis MX1]
DLTPTTDKSTSALSCQWSSNSHPISLIQQPQPQQDGKRLLLLTGSSCKMLLRPTGSLSLSLSLSLFCATSEKRFLRNVKEIKTRQAHVKYADGSRDPRLSSLFAKGSQAHTWSSKNHGTKTRPSPALNAMPAAISEPPKGVC